MVIAFEERIYDAVVDDLQMREPTEDFKAIHVICLDTKVRDCHQVGISAHYIFFAIHRLTGLFRLCQNCVNHIHNIVG